MKRMFTCSVCNTTQESTWTEKEAIAEKNALFGDTPLDQCAVLCDDCFNQVMKPPSEAPEAFMEAVRKSLKPLASIAILAAAPLTAHAQQYAPLFYNGQYGGAVYGQGPSNNYQKPPQRQQFNPPHVPNNVPTVTTPFGSYPCTIPGCR